ncbi:MAG: creatininase [Gammaproteobacteria bacterium]|nr:creatininase [Gammaproteobacteria bacterium]
MLLLLALLQSVQAQTITEEELLSLESPIAPAHSYWLEELTFIEIRDLIASGTSTVIIPTGGIEENGPYLAIGKHNLILEATCPAIAQKLGNALCAPIVKFVPEGNIDPPSGAMKFPGTISLSDDTYEALLVDIASSLRQAGFKDIILIGDSGGNQRGMEKVAIALNETWSDLTTSVHFVPEFYNPGWTKTELFSEQELGLTQTKSDGYHDDIWVTAMMTVTDPEQVRYQQRAEAGLDSINGISISPIAETVELGRKMIEFRAKYTAQAIQNRIEVLN